MDLDVNDKVIKNASAEDVAGAFAAGPFTDGWFITLETENDASLDAIAEDDGRFTLTYADDGTKRRRSDVDAATVQTVFLKFLAGDPHWHADGVWQDLKPAKAKAGASVKFVPDTRPVAARKGGEPPTWAMAVMIGIVAMIGLIFTVSKWDHGATLRAIMPFADSDYFYIGLIFLPMLALIVLMVISKAVDFRKAQGWSTAGGHIVRSEMTTRRHRFSGESETIVNEPAIEYEFKAGGRTVRGSRIGIGDDSGGANSAATLKRYPQGSLVTVYYDPADPKNCVLERGGPLDMKDGKTLKGCAGALALLALFGAAIWWLIARGPDFVAARFPKSEPEIVIFALCFALALLLFFAGLFRYQRRASHWPSVRGKIIASTVESYQERGGGSGGRTTTMYRPVVEFAYTVNGLNYRSKQIKLLTVVSGSQASAEKVVAKYPEGGDVDVHYDPASPDQAALENPTGMAWIVLAIALALSALAIWKLGIFA